MPDATLIKRYANRRLYDTGTSRYITIDDLATRLRDGERIRVVDAQSGDDMTRRVLLQVILHEGQLIADLLPEDFLYTLLRLKDGAMTRLFVSYLEMSMDAFRLARTQMEANLKRFRQQSQMSAQWMSGLFPFPGGGGSGPIGGEPTESGEGEGGE